MPQTESDPPSIVARSHPAGSTLGPAVEQLQMLRQEALNEGRREDAADYERMMRHLTSRMQQRRGGDAPMWQMAILAAFMSAVIVASVHYLF